MQVLGKYHFILCSLVLINCHQVRKADGSQNEKPLLNIEQRQSTESSLRLSPLDTLGALTKSGKKLRLLVFAYNDSPNEKSIKSFEVQSVENNEVIFRSVSKRLNLGVEIDHSTDTNDSIIALPSYYILSYNPLKVKLRLNLSGESFLSFFSDLTCDLKYYSNDQSKKYIDLLLYEFVSTDKKEIKTYLQYAPHECNTSSEVLLTNFNKLKYERHLSTEQGNELMKLSFICFTQGANPKYQSILSEFQIEIGESLSPYNYYPYVIYLNNFFVNSNPLNSLQDWLAQH
jgi:hypothetical protein